MLKRSKNIESIKNMKNISIDLQNLESIKEFFLAIIRLILGRFKTLSINDKQLYATLKRSFRAVLFNIFGILPLVTWRGLLLAQERVLTEYFIREAVRARKLKRKRAVLQLRKVPTYFYFTSFLRRPRSLPPSMPKEASCYKRSVTLNFTFKLDYNHKIKLDKRALHILVPDQATKKKNNSKLKFVFLKKSDKKPVQKKRKNVLIQRLVPKPFLKNKILVYGFFDINNRRSILFHSASNINNPVREILRSFIRNKLIAKRYVTRQRKKKRRYRRRFSRFHSQAYYRIRRIERKKRKKILRAKRRAKREKQRYWLESGLRFWHPRGFYLNKHILLHCMRSFNKDQFTDLVKMISVIFTIIGACQYVIKLYSNPVLKLVDNYSFYRKYYNWVLSQTKTIRLRWKFRRLSRLTKRYRLLPFSCIDPISGKHLKRKIRLKGRNWFVITLKWSARNFHLNIFSTKHKGGIFKVSGGLLGAKKKNKRRFRYIRKGLHYLFRFLLFYRRRMLKRQKKKIISYYKTLDLWNSSENQNRFSQRRSILLDLRRWLRLEKRRLTFHLVMEWFGREDKYSLYVRFIKRLRKIQSYRLLDKIGRLRSKLRSKKRKYKLAIKDLVAEER